MKCKLKIPQSIQFFCWLIVIILGISLLFSCLMLMQIGTFTAGNQPLLIVTMLLQAVVIGLDLHMLYQCHVTLDSQALHICFGIFRVHIPLQSIYTLRIFSQGIAVYYAKNDAPHARNLDLFESDISPFLTLIRTFKPDIQIDDTTKCPDEKNS